MQRRGFTLGVGCRRGADPLALADLVASVLAEAGIDRSQLVAMATIAGKENEPAVIALSEVLGLAVQHFSAGRLDEETPRLVTPSEIVFRETGCHGVAESAALVAAGERGRLVVPKRVAGGCTAAVAKGAKT